MSRKMLVVACTFIVAMILSACGSNQSNSYENKAPVAIDVTLNVPSKAKVNEKVILMAEVKQGNEKVKDADEVKYQIWENDDINDSKMLNAKNEKNGTYSSKAVFDHDGVYHVQVHVTARGMHTMPKTKIIVGNPQQTKK
jgi:hypothetical protein